MRTGHIALSSAIATVAASYAASIVFMFLARIDVDVARPWSIYQYLYYYGHDPKLANAFLLAGTAALLAAGGVLYLLLKPASSGAYGDARWARQHEIKEAGLLGNTGILIGKRFGTYFCAEGPLHVLVFAPTRSGKGVGFVVPNLLHWQGSVICHDIKGENFRLTSGFRAKHGQRVFFFNPADPDGNTHSYNPLDFVSTEPGRRVDDVQKIAHLLLPGDAKDFWPVEARTLFVGLSLYLLDIKPYPATLGNVLRTTRMHANFVEFVTGVLEQRRDALDPNAFMALNAFLQKAPKEQSGVLSTLSSALELWANPVIDAATSRSDFDLHTLKKERTTIYVGVTPNNLRRMKPLLHVFYQQALDFLTTNEPGPDEPHKVLLLMDEFTSLQRMQQFEDSIAFLASYGVRMMTIIQSPSQVESHYGVAGMRTLFANSKIRVAYAANDYDTADMISKLLGTQTMIRRSKSTSRPIGFTGTSNGSSSESESEFARPLLLPQELLQLDPKQEIVLVEGYPPVKAKKIRYHEDSRFKNRLYPPATVPKVQIENRSELLVPANSAPLDDAELAAVLDVLDTTGTKRK